MAKAKTEAEYQEWIKEVSAKVPDEHKGAFEAITNSVGMDLFGGHLRQSEFHRRLNELHQEKAELAAQQAEYEARVNSMDAWYQDEAPKNQRLIAERDKLRAEVEASRERLAALGLEEEPTKVTAARRSDEGGLSQEIQALKAHIVAMDRALPQMLADYGTTLRDGLKNGYEFDPRQLIAVSMERSVPIQQAYEMVTFEERQKRFEKEREEAIEKAREDGRREALSQRGSPEYMKRSGPSILDTISKPQTQRERVEGAVAEYLQTAT